MAEIFRRIKNQNYTVMCNHHLQNDRLSLKAMGLMSKILSLPDDWNYSVRGMTAVCKDGYESVRTAFLELEREGYIVRHRIRDEKGHILRTEYFILETPDTEIPEEYLTEQQEKTLHDPAGPEAAVQKNEADQCDGQMKLEDILPGSENPIVDEKSEELPGSENPIVGKNVVQNPPGSDFPTTENRHQQNTNITNIYNNIYNKQHKFNNSSSSSSSFAMSNINTTGSPAETCRLEEEEEEIKKRIGYQRLLEDGHDPQLVEEVLRILSDYSTGKNIRQYTYIGQTKILSKDVSDRLCRLKYEQISSVLCHIRHGPEIRNLRRYLLTALFQADLTVKLNQCRKQAVSGERRGFNNFHQREYDYDKLEQALLDRSVQEEEEGREI